MYNYFPCWPLLKMSQGYTVIAEYLNSDRNCTPSQFSHRKIA